MVAQRYGRLTLAEAKRSRRTLKKPNAKTANRRCVPFGLEIRYSTIKRRQARNIQRQLKG